MIINDTFEKQMRSIVRRIARLERQTPHRGSDSRGVAARRGGRATNASISPGVAILNPGPVMFNTGFGVGDNGFFAPYHGIYSASASVRLSGVSSDEFQVRLAGADNRRVAINSGRFYVSVSDAAFEMAEGEGLYVEVYNNASSSVTVEPFPNFDAPTLSVALVRRL